MKHGSLTSAKAGLAALLLGATLATAGVGGAALAASGGGGSTTETPTCNKGWVGRWPSPATMRKGSPSSS